MTDKTLREEIAEIKLMCQVLAIELEDLAKQQQRIVAKDYNAISTQACSGHTNY